MFKLKDYVIYPGHGVALVEEIIKKVVAGAPIEFLKLTFVFKDMTILVPLYNAQSIGIRYPCPEREVDAVLKELLQRPEKKLAGVDFTPSGWNRRHRDYQIKILSGNLLEITKIYRDLMHVAQQKDLSFGERAVLQTTEDLIVQEIQVVRNDKRENVMQELRNPFKRFEFHDRSFLQQESPSL
ncbi:MAG: CarD family transcriptional regulator [Candidatus Babeliales bacterium]|jgi:CarD family transcriptional regulator